MGRHKNYRQEDALIEYMRNHADIARGGYTRADNIDVENLWKDLVEDLNSLGPPIHDTTGWKKIWSCWKSAIKKKISTSRKEVLATLGGPYNQIYISKREEEVGRICGLYELVEGIANAKSAGDESESDKSSSSEADLVLIEQPSSSKSDLSSKRKRNCEDVTPTQNKRKTSTDNIEDNLKTYVESDIKNGKELSETLKRISEIAEKTNENINAISYSITRTYKSIETLATNICKELKRHHKEMEEKAAEKNELRKLDLEIKQKHLELEEFKKNFNKNQ